MNIYNAIRSIYDGQAVRPSGWRGYVERDDKTPADSEYSETGSYSVGDKVVYNGSRYVCVSATSAVPFDISKWERIGRDFYLVFVDADDDETTGGTANPSAVYLSSVAGLTDTARKMTRVSGPVPVEVTARHPSWTGNIPDPVDMPDEDLLAALVSDTWETGTQEDFETVRIHPEGSRW